MSAKWTCISWPPKTLAAAELAKQHAAMSRERFFEEMLNEQERFSRSLNVLEKSVDDFTLFGDLAQVADASDEATAIGDAMAEAEAKATLFNDREDLFNSEVTEYEQLSRVKKNFEPYKNLWVTAAEWLDKSAEWLNGSFLMLDAEKVEEDVTAMGLTIVKTAKFFASNGLDKQAHVAEQIKEQVAAFKPHVPIMTALRTKGMATRHWERISTDTGKRIMPDDAFTLTDALELDLGAQLETVEKIAESAAKEYTIEMTLDKMLEEWKGMFLIIQDYRDSGTGVVKGVDEIMAVLDEHVDRKSVV